MKKIFVIIISTFTMVLQAQDLKTLPLISVSGEGKIKVSPDQVIVTVSQDSKGVNAQEVKKENDAKIDLILKFIKKMNIPTTDYLTQRVALYPNYDYDSKKQEYIASQTVSIILKDLSKYDDLMNGLIASGINKIDNVEFKSSKIVQLQSDARKLAVKNAKQKAEDFVSVLGQKVGKAFSISDTSQNHNPNPILFTAMKTASMDGGYASQETLAAGEIEVIVNVNVSFLLE